MSILQTSKLTKDYGKGRGAFDIDLDLQPGEIVGFLGPNGAGKTTTIRMILDFTNQDSGTVSIFGSEIKTKEDLLAVIDRIGFLPGDPVFYNLKVSDILNYSLKLSTKGSRENLKRLVQEFELDVSKKFSHLSLGNKKKVAIINAFVNEPDLLMLDEPTNSLDPLMQSKVLEEIKAVKARGGTVFFSSHVLSEVEKIADKIIVIKDGRIVLQGDKSSVLSNGTKKIIIYHKEGDKLQKILKGFDITLRNTGEYIVVTDSLKKIIPLLLKNNIEEFFIERPTLEDIFMKYYEK